MRACYVQVSLRLPATSFHCLTNDAVCKSAPGCAGRFRVAHHGVLPTEMGAEPSEPSCAERLLPASRRRLTYGTRVTAARRSTYRNGGFG